MSRRRILLAAGGGLLALLGILLVLPFFFVDEIEARIRAEIGRATALEVDWEDAGLGLIRSFPNPALTLRGLTVARGEAAPADTLARVDGLRVVVDGRSALGVIRGSGPLVIRSVRIEHPTLRLVRSAGIASGVCCGEAFATASCHHTSRPSVHATSSSVRL